MKREICCPACAKTWRKVMRWDRAADPAGKFPGFNEDGEGMRQVEGTTTREFLCDGCGGDLPAGSQATAVSLYSVSAPYSPWESEFIERPMP